MFSLATCVEVLDPLTEDPSAVLATFTGADIVEIAACLKIEPGTAPVCGSKVEGFRVRILDSGNLLGEIRYFFSSISILGWNSKALLKEDTALSEWLRTKGIVAPCSRLPPEWQSVIPRLRPGLSAEEVLSMVADAKENLGGGEYEPEARI